MRESKELEDSKKRHTDEYGISRLDYLYNQHSISNTNNRRIVTKPYFLGSVWLRLCIFVLIGE